MSKKSRFRGPFHVKRVEPLYKSAWQHLYHICWSLPSQLGWEKSLFLTYPILGLLVNTYAADGKYPVLTRDNLTIPIQMQLSDKQNSFYHSFAAFLRSRINFKYSEKRMTHIDFVFPKLWTAKTWSDKCLKSPVSEDPSTSNKVNLPNQCWNLHDSIFIKIIDHCQVNWVGRSLCFSQTKSWDCFLTHWLPMKSILFLIETI